MNCPRCGIEIADVILDEDKARSWIHSDEDCANRQTEKLRALAEHGITIDEVVSFAAFTPEAKAAYPTTPKWLIRTNGEELRRSVAEDRLSRAVTFLQRVYVREGWQSVADLLGELGAEVAKL